MELECGRPGRPPVGAGVQPPGTCVSLATQNGVRLAVEGGALKESHAAVQQGCVEQQGCTEQRDSMGTLGALLSTLGVLLQVQCICGSSRLV